MQADFDFIKPIGSVCMLYIYGNIDHEYTPNVSIYTIHGSYGYWGYYVIQQDIFGLFSPGMAEAEDLSCDI